MIIGLETILWVWYDIEFMKTRMDHEKIINISDRDGERIQIAHVSTKWTRID